MSVEQQQRMATLGDILTPPELRQCHPATSRQNGDEHPIGRAIVDAVRSADGEFNMGRAVERVDAEVIAPALSAINARLGQENDARYLAYAVVYAITRST